MGDGVAPAPGKTIQFVPATRGQTQQTMTGSDGRYSIDLVPGAYEVRVDGYAPTQFGYGRDPKTYGQWPKVTVTVGREIKLDLIYFSGIA